MDLDLTFLLLIVIPAICAASTLVYSARYWNRTKVLLLANLASYLFAILLFDSKRSDVLQLLLGIGAQLFPAVFLFLQIYFKTRNVYFVAFSLMEVLRAVLFSALIMSGATVGSVQRGVHSLIHLAVAASLFHRGTNIVGILAVLAGMFSLGIAFFDVLFIFWFSMSVVLRTLTAIGLDLLPAKE